MRHSARRALRSWACVAFKSLRRPRPRRPVRCCRKHPMLADACLVSKIQSARRFRADVSSCLPHRLRDRAAIDEETVRTSCAHQRFAFDWREDAPTCAPCARTMTAAASPTDGAAPISSPHCRRRPRVMCPAQRLLPLTATLAGRPSTDLQRPKRVVFRGPTHRQVRDCRTVFY